jgi:F0F1-type ATP synthase epsilon subunit
MSESLQLVIRTPHEVVLDARVRAARVPTPTGHVGLRPGEEPFVVSIEPGLVVTWAADRVSFAASAGGLLDAERSRAVLYTPFAVVGDDGDALLDRLDEALATPDSELAARRRLGELEERIVQELRHRPAVAQVRRARG